MLSWIDCISGKFVECVPEEIAVCEFDCRTTECAVNHWETCELRLKSMQAPKQIAIKQD